MSENSPRVPKTQVPWQAVVELLQACGIEAPDFRYIQRVEYDQAARQVSVTRVRLSETGFVINTPGGRLTETFQLGVST